MVTADYVKDVSQRRSNKARMTGREAHARP
jgi:hypothetical protein